VGIRLRARFGDGVAVSDVFGHAVADVGAAEYRDVVRFLRDEPDLACDFCDFTGGVDLGEAAVLPWSITAMTLALSLRCKQR
jgi:hypothetical protein